MEEKQVPYDWETYYRAAYEKVKKKNTILAARIADAQSKAEELGFRLGRIEKSIFWKMSAPFRKCYYALFSQNGKRQAADSKDLSAPKEYLEEYRQEVFRQKHPYLQWILENEGPGHGQEPDPGRRINGWHKIDMENGELCVIVCGDGVLDEKAEQIIGEWFENNRRNCVFAYGGEDYYWENLSGRMHPRFKPCWSPDTMLSFCYVGHMVIVNKALYHGLLEGQDYSTGSYADFYDLCFRLEERVHALREGDMLARTLRKGRSMPERVGNIEYVLFHNRFEPDAEGMRRIEEARQSGADILETAEKLLQEKLDQGYDMTGCGAAYRSVREAAVSRRGIRAHLEPGAERDVYHLCYDVDKNTVRTAMVSVIILSRDHPELLERCLSSFREKTEYTNYEWIVVDNGSSAENKARVESLQKEYGFRYLYHPMEFNFSALCNLGVRNAGADYVLLLNDDIEVIQKDWLRIMLGQAAQPHVGAVGAKLWYAGGDTIQHAGITNMGIGPSHKLASLADDRVYYYGHNRLVYDVAGVTAACLLVERKKYLEVGGLDEAMKVAYNDVDFCFKLTEKGYYNVLRNDAVLYHYESMSRGLDHDDRGKWNRLLYEKEALYAKHPAMKGQDAFYGRHLNDDNINYTCNYKFDYMKKEKLSAVTPADAGSLRGAKADRVRLALDQVGEQQKGTPDEPDIMVITGWSFIPGEDNARYTREILLKGEDGTVYRAELFPWYRKDVEKVLAQETNILLSGFVSRIARDRLSPGQWKVGMAAQDRESCRKYVTWSEKALVIEV